MAESLIERKVPGKFRDKGKSARGPQGCGKKAGLKLGARR